MDSEKLLVSIVMPVFNAEDYLEEALNSCLQQTYRPLEIICVNNNSIDGSWPILQSFQKKHQESIRIFTEGKPGAPAARNRGIKECKGEYILFLDADDALFNFSVELLMEYQSCEIDAVCGGENYYNKSIQDNIIFQRLRIPNEDQNISDILYDNPNTGAVLLKKSSIRGVNWDESLSSDQEFVFWSQLCLENHIKLKYVPQPVCKIRIHDSPLRISNQSRKKRAHNKFIALMKIQSLLENSDHKSEKALIALNDLFLNLSFNSINSKNFKISRLSAAKVKKAFIPKSHKFKRFSKEGITYFTNHYFGFLFHFLGYKLLGKYYLKNS